MGYFKPASYGILWMGALRGITRGVAFLKIAVLARLLSPLQFGLYGIASLVLALLEIVTETGINYFLIQEKSEIEDYLDSAWLVSIIRGLIISTFILIFAIPVSSFFNSPEVLSLILLISIVPFLRGFINPAIIKFQKNLEFKKEFAFRVIIFIIDAAISIYLAFLTRSATSLVWGMIAGATLEVLLSWVLVRTWPKLKVESIKVKKVLQRGKWITFAGIFDYLFHNIDDAVVGKLLNTSALGFYQVAYKISTLPITEGGAVIGRVVFPIYSKIADDLVRLRSAYLKVLGFTSLTTVSFGLILMIFADSLTLFFLGSNWLVIVPTLKVLAIFGVIRAVTATSFALFLAAKKQEYITFLTTVSIFGLAITILPLVEKFGLVGAAYASLVGAILGLPVMLYYTRKTLYDKES